MSQRELSHIAKNMSSDLYSFTVRHMAACRNCKRNQGGRCRLMDALGLFDHQLQVEMKRGRR